MSNDYGSSAAAAYWSPYSERFGTQINEVAYSGDTNDLVEIFEKRDNDWDVINVNGAAAHRLCEAGLVQRIDWKQVVGKDRFLAETINECGVGTAVRSRVLAYHVKHVGAAPMSWEALFDLKRYPGKRALEQTPIGNLELALMADGVAAKEVYAVLRTEAGIHRALTKLDKIKENVVWWSEPQEPVRLLLERKVDLAAVYSDQIAHAIIREKENLEIIWQRQMFETKFWVVPTKARWPGHAIDFIRTASRGELQAKQMGAIYFGPVATDAFEHLDKLVVRYLPTAPENFKAAFQIDAVFWSENLSKLEERFEKWRSD